MRQSRVRHTLFHDQSKTLTIAGDLISAAVLLTLVVLFFFRAEMVLNYRWNWSPVFNSIFSRNGLLLRGFLTTIRLSVWATIFAFLIGTLVGVGRLSGNLFARLVSGAYVSLIRNIPPLVLVFIFYFFFSSQLLDPLGLDSIVRRASPETRRIVAILFAEPGRITAFFSAVLTLAIYEGSYIAEIVRSGIQSVDRGQWEASWAIGLSRIDRMRFVILPQALRHVLPALAGQFISTMKDSAIVSVISIGELTFQGMELTAATYRTLEIWISVTLLYFILTFSFSQVIGFMERRLRARYSD
jgi:polar amino acid transport system permease protein